MKKESTVSFSKKDSLAIKGIAIFMLMCLHCFGATWRFEGYSFDFGPLGQNVYVALCGYCRVCVAIFAFISGYGLYLSAKGKCEGKNEINLWITDRVFKTFNGFWFLYIVSFIILPFSGSYLKNKYFSDGIPDGLLYVLIDFLGISKIFGTPSLNGSWWYMGATFVYIIMMPFVVKWVKKYGFLSLICLIVAVPRIFLKHKFLGAGSIYTFMPVLLLGALFAEKNLFYKLDHIKLTKKKTLDEIIVFLLLAAFLAGNVIMWVAVRYTIVWEYSLGIIPISVILFCYKYVVKIPGVNRFLCFLGKHSMNIYLFHTFIRSIFLRDFIYGFKIPIFGILSLLFLSLGVSILLEAAKKLLHYEKFVNRLKEKVVKYIC
nr:acyltransferase [Lachnospiraceae bacterium]